MQNKALKTHTQREREREAFTETFTDGDYNDTGYFPYKTHVSRVNVESKILLSSQHKKSYLEIKLNCASIECIFIHLLQSQHNQHNSNMVADNMYNSQN
jgi:hypothetical protein